MKKVGWIIILSALLLVLLVGCAASDKAVDTAPDAAQSPDAQIEVDEVAPFTWMDDCQFETVLIEGDTVTSCRCLFFGQRTPFERQIKGLKTYQQFLEFREQHLAAWQALEGKPGHRTSDVTYPEQLEAYDEFFFETHDLVFYCYTCYNGLAFYVQGLSVDDGTLNVCLAAIPKGWSMSTSEFAYFFEIPKCDFDQVDFRIINLNREEQATVLRPQAKQDDAPTEMPKGENVRFNVFCDYLPSELASWESVKSSDPYGEVLQLVALKRYDQATEWLTAQKEAWRTYADKYSWFDSRACDYLDLVEARDEAFYRDHHLLVLSYMPSRYYQLNVEQLTLDDGKLTVSISASAPNEIVFFRPGAFFVLEITAVEYDDLRYDVHYSPMTMGLESQFDFVDGDTSVPCRAFYFDEATPVEPDNLSDGVGTLVQLEVFETLDELAELGFFHRHLWSSYAREHDLHTSWYPAYIYRLSHYFEDYFEDHNLIFLSYYVKNGTREYYVDEVALGNGTLTIKFAYTDPVTPPAEGRSFLFLIEVPKCEYNQVKYTVETISSDE